MASPEAESFQTKDRRDDFPIFIHSELDDYGLDAVEFRVYARLARRAGQHGKHSESVPNMAREFDVCVRKVQYALKLLILCRLVTRHPRPGKTDEYSLNPRSVWRNKTQVSALRESIRASGAPAEGTKSGARTASGAPAEGGVVHPQHGVVVHPEIDEGTPSEGTPFKVEEELNNSFDGSNSRPERNIQRLIVESGLSMVQICQHAERRGYKLTHSFVAGLTQGAITSPGLRSVQALAVGLGLSDLQVFAALGVPCPPFRGTDFMEALAAYDKTAKQRRVKESPEQRRILFKKLERMGEERATQALENSVENSWRGVFEPKDGNGNGTRPTDAAQRNARRLVGNIELIRKLRSGAR